jgi:hypothetical protein
MKKFLHISIMAAAVLVSGILSAQTVYNVTQDVTVTGANMPSQCENCVVNISKGVTLTIDKEIFLKKTTFNGGTILANSKITFWADGAFNDTKVIVKDKSALVTSGQSIMNITNTEMTFYGDATATFWAVTTLDKSKLTFLDNSGMVSTVGFIMKNNSGLIAGDGTTKSKAYIKFDGGDLSLYDNSYVSLQNYNNYYYNWKNYYSASNNKSYQTTNNNMNCGTAGKNGCQSQYLYGPASLNYAGAASSAVLPVKLSAFAVKLSGAVAIITWTTDMEANSNHFNIEHSVDGISWTTIAEVKSKGNSSIKTNYTYTDDLKISATVSYRLKMVDQDEAFAYSPIRSVKADVQSTMNIYPNPATNYVVINSKNNSVKNVQLINRNGQVVKQANGTNNINLTVSEFTAGNYFVKVSDSTGNTQTFKLIINK